MHPPRPFALERFFAAHEFRVPHMASASDCESLSLAELLALADPECRRLWDELRLGYTQTAGHPLLRAAIADMYATAAPDDVRVSAPEEAVFLALHALLSPGDHVVCMTPAYQSLLDVPVMIGCTVANWNVAAQDGGWTLDLDALERLCRPNTRGLVVNFPHNPTGYHPARATFDAILDFARRRDLWVLSDEIYRFLEAEPGQRLPSACDVYERGITFCGLSKAFGLPGLRIGWVAAHDSEFLRRCTEWHDFTSICSSAPSEILALIAVRERDQIFAREQRLVQENRERARDFFARHADLFLWRPPAAGPLGIAEWRGPCSFNEWFDRLRARGVLIAPGRLFGLAENSFRVGLGRRSFPTVLALIEEEIKALRSG